MITRSKMEITGGRKRSRGDNNEGEKQEKLKGRQQVDVEADDGALVIDDYYYCCCFSSSATLKSTTAIS